MMCLTGPGKCVGIAPGCPVGVSAPATMVSAPIAIERTVFVT